ncbi:MAG: ribonuclease P protein component [Thermotogaceae bacterium]|nr:ribonuclease P protein component [Thermotogota bacterium]NLH19611.1 ribonuclease P protein component [Thermotogaceae bacterium]
MKKHAFPKTQRLSKDSEFVQVLRRGKSIETPYFVLLYLENPYGNDRIGISVKKKFGNAVKRNRLKRWVREVFRTRGRRGKETGGAHFDMIILPRKKLSSRFEEMTFGEIAKPILECFEKVDRIARARDDAAHPILSE